MKPAAPDEHAAVVINPVELPGWALRLARTLARECRPDGATYAVRVTTSTFTGGPVNWIIAREEVIRQNANAAGPVPAS